MSKTRALAAIVAAICVVSAAQAVTVPFTENFDADNANWQNNANGLAVFNAAGGPDNSGYISAPFNFQNSAVDATPVLLRARPTTPFGPASGGNFIGNWLSNGVNSFSAYVRHNASEPLTYFARFADPLGFPGLIVGDTTSVLPNTWTLVDFKISPNNPNNFTEGQPFSAVFDSIGHVQLGVFVPAGLAGVNQEFTFDVDQVTIDVPEPASLTMAGLAVVLGGVLRRRCR